MKDSETCLVLVGLVAFVLIGTHVIYALCDVMTSTPHWWVGVFSGFCILLVGVPTLACLGVLLYLLGVIIIYLLNKLQ